MHGLCANYNLRRAWLRGLGISATVGRFRQARQDAFDRLADAVEDALDVRLSNTERRRADTELHRENEPDMNQAPLFLALLLDLTLGDPPNTFHPVAGMGTIIRAAQRYAPRRGRLAPLIYGALLAVGGASTMGGLGRLLEHATARLPYPWHWLVGAGLLKVTFSLRGLAKAAGEVEDALADDDLPAARQLLSWHLVSRDTSALNALQVAAATVESVAENTSDSIVAPLFYYVVGGLPAALVYRFLNTADAMLGYRDPAHEWLGKVPARLDDLANLIPARLTAFLFILSTPLVNGDIGRAWWIWRRDASVTASPNAGHPMSAAAGALGVELEKVGQYQLGKGLQPPTTGDIRRSIHLMYIATTLVAIVGIVLSRFRRRNGH